jgi:hypothetical protein
MARRSLGVVLIVALLGWTVNQPIMGCEGQNSRAAVGVPAGASPAYQPEPSPTRHSCCPRESQTATQPSFPSHLCHYQFGSSSDCCSVRGQLQSAALPALLRSGTSLECVVASDSTPSTTDRKSHQSSSKLEVAGIHANSFAVLRL